MAWNTHESKKSIWTRFDDRSDWHEQQFSSISEAKERNGLNSRTYRSPSELPPKRVPAG